MKFTTVWLSLPIISSTFFSEDDCLCFLYFFLCLRFLTLLPLLFWSLFVPNLRYESISSSLDVLVSPLPRFSKLDERLYLQEIIIGNEMNYSSYFLDTLNPTLLGNNELPSFINRRIWLDNIFSSGMIRSRWTWISAIFIAL